MNITQSFSDALSAVVSFLPRALAFIVILVVGWIVAAVLRRVVTALLSRVGMDRLAERGGVHRYTGKYTVSQMTGTLVYALIWLFTLQIAFNAFGTNPISVVLNDLVAWLPQLFIAGVIMVVAFAIANMVFDLVSNMMSSASYGKTLARIAQVAIIVVAAIAALNQIGIATTVTTPILVAGLAMIAGIAIVGVGGGLIQPMRQRWERMLGAVESETTKMRGSSASLNRNVGSESMQPSYQSSQYGQPSTQQPSTEQQGVSSSRETTNPGSAPGYDGQVGQNPPAPGSES